MNRKKFLILLLVSFFVVKCSYSNNYGITIKSHSAIIIDQKTGVVLFAKNPNKKHFPASTTKILTASLALEHGKLSDPITVSRKAAYGIEPGSSSIALKPGEKVTLKDVLYGLMLRSANECGNIIAEYLSESNKKFAIMMNEEAQKIGCKNTHFSNPHGLHDENHYSTAYDLALIGQHSMTIPKFKEIVSTRYYKFPTTNKHKSEERGSLKNKNKMINPKSKYFFQSCTGIKAGYTKKSLHTFVASAEKNGNSIIAVVLKAPSKKDMYNDLNLLLKHGLEQFQLRTLVDDNFLIDEMQIKGGNNKLKIMTDKKVEFVLPFSLSSKKIVKKIALDKIILPVNEGNPLGKLQFFYKNHFLGESTLVAGCDVLKKWSWKNLKKYFISWPFITLSILFLCAIILLIPVPFDKRKKNQFML